MTDTGGKTIAGGGKGISRKLRTYEEQDTLQRAATGSGASARKKAGVPPTAAPIGPILTVNVWEPLAKEGVLDPLFRASELIYYLQQMARFIQRCTNGSAEDAAQEFGVHATSPFNRLQRRIREGAPGNVQSDLQKSEHHHRATRAFMAGSTNWAKQILNREDATTITIEQIAAIVQRDSDRALVLAPRLILLDYGEQVYGTFVTRDENGVSIAEKHMREEYQSQLERFFTKYGASHWTERNIPKTMAAFVTEVRHV